jgi:hypothetical protein
MSEITRTPELPLEKRIDLLALTFTGAAYPHLLESEPGRLYYNDVKKLLNDLLAVQAKLADERFEYALTAALNANKDYGLTQLTYPDRVEVEQAARKIWYEGGSTDGK